MDHDFSWRGTYTSRVPPRVAVARTAITRVAITRVVITHVASYYTRGWLLHAWLAITRVANTRVAITLTRGAQTIENSVHNCEKSKCSEFINSSKHY